MSNSSKFILGAASLGSLVAAQVSNATPYTLEVSIIDDKMANIAATFQGQSLPKMNLDNNVKQNLVFVDTCTQSLGGVAAPCSSSPTNVVSSVVDLTLSGVGVNFTGHEQAGFLADGRKATGDFVITMESQLDPLNPTTQTVSDTAAYTVQSVSEDVWHFDSGVQGGQMSVAGDSVFIAATKDADTNRSAFFLETGPIVNQNFAGGEYPGTGPVSYIGGSDYSTIVDSAQPAVTATADLDGRYPLDYVGFGQATFDSSTPPVLTEAYYQSLGYPGQSQSAVIATNFVGIGLPEYLWYQVTNLLYKVDTAVAADLVCDPNMGGACLLTKTCDQYPNLWSAGWSFKIQMTGSTNYMLVPIGALAVTENSQCNLYLEFLNNEKYTQSSNVVLGSLFLQQYATLFYYDLTAVTTDLSMYLSSQTKLTGAYIGAESATQGTDPFTVLHGTTQQVYINTDQFSYKTTIGASLGFQGQTQFQVSLLGNYVFAYTTECMKNGGGAIMISCAVEPTFATNYFDKTVYYQEGVSESYEADYAGYFTSGYKYEAGVCVNVKDTESFCTTSNQEFYGADQVTKNTWNYYSAAASGTFGMGKNSPIWTILGSPSTKQYDVYMTNFNTWTWANPDYVPNSAQSIMNIGMFSSDYTESMAHTTFSPNTIGGHLFELESFGFGKTDDSANTQYYKDLLNSDVDIYGGLANTSQLALNFRGLGLPGHQFDKFANLLSVITKGESTCLNYLSGYCALANPCEYYQNTGLWDYDFKIQFASQQDLNYIRVPLATFAANYDGENGACVVFVEYLQELYTDSQSIILGGMFFQSFYAQYTQLGVNAVTVALYVNLNALPNTYIGAIDYSEGETVFNVPIAHLQTDSLTERNGLPTFAATLSGITDSSPYFYLDFGADHSIVWTTDCQTTGIGQYTPGDCSAEPTLMNMGFSGDALPENARDVGTFSQARFGGYIVSGTQYTSELCFGAYNCKFVNVYAANQVSADNWLYDYDGAYGILGMGPHSYIWEGFVDPDTRKAYYSIELGRVSFYNNGKASNITFGDASSAQGDNRYGAYENQVNLTVTGDKYNYSYPVSNFSFGTVYQTDGVDSSEFFYEMALGYPVTFATNFKGLGLPANLYAQFETLFEYVTADEVECDNTLDGICVLPGKCANYTAYEDFTFKLNFTDANDGNYMRIPLASFAEEVLVGGGESKCNLYVTYLDENNFQSSDIILGGMFFQEFYGLFTNNYTDVQDPTQTVALFVGQNAQLNPYIGNAVLPTGVNPFIPQPAAPEEEKRSVVWIVILLLLCAILLGLLGFALYNWKIAQTAAFEKKMEQEDQQKLVNNSDSDRPIGVE